MLDNKRDFNKVKVNLLHKETKGLEKLWMLRNLTEGWYIYCQKFRHRKLNTYQNLRIYFRESIYISRGNSTMQSNYLTYYEKKLQDF